MTIRILRNGAGALALLVLSGCASGHGMRAGDAAAKKGDWDTAVAYYREALGHDPSRFEVRIALERAMRQAADEHFKRARDLEMQEQLAGAMAEYKSAASLDPSSTIAMTKALEIERRLRDQSDASRPRPLIDQLNQQAAASSPIPHLDPRVPVAAYNFSGSVKAILDFIGNATGINVTYDALGNIPGLNNLYSVNVQDATLEQILNQVLTANTLTYKIVNSKTILVYADNQGNRAKYEDQYLQTFYISNAELNDLQQILMQLLAQGSTSSRPIIFPNKSANTLVVRATAPVMAIVEQVIRANDKPRAEVLVDVEIMEVDRGRARQLGLDLSQYALGFTFSPESAPPNTSAQAGAIPAQPPPINLTTLTSGGIRTSDFYVSTPAALIRLLESDDRTRILAKPQLRGREGAPLTLNLGQDIPIATTQFSAVGAGGANNVPATQIAYRTIGVILQMTPHVTYQDEIYLENLSVENSSVGQSVIAGGQAAPSFVDRHATVNIRLRDGESNLLAGLISENEKKTYTSLPGLSSIPFFRLLFGNVSSTHDQTDIVMIVTPHIVRGHDLTTSDLKPMYIGTAQNLGASGQPSLLSPEVPVSRTAGATPPAGANNAPPSTTGTTPVPSVSGAGAPPTPPAANPRIVAVEPVTDAAVNPPKDAPPPQVILTAPATMQVGGQPYTTAIQASGFSQLGTVSVTLTYDPKILKAGTVSEGTFMKQGGVQTSFVQKVDPLLGRVDITITRPGESGASGTNLLAAVTFQGVAPGTATIKITAVAMTGTGKSIPILTTPVTVTVK